MGSFQHPAGAEERLHQVGVLPARIMTTSRERESSCVFCVGFFEASFLPSAEQKFVFETYPIMNFEMFINNFTNLKVPGWWLGTVVIFHILGIIIPIDELHHFSEG